MAQVDQGKLRKRLEVLLKQPENMVCADCKKRGARWASANLGIFICIECSGIHRNLGVHISFVRSVNLDSWTLKQVEHMEEWGNGRANLYYEANVPSHVTRPKEGDSVRVIERYIRDKYEHKRYIAECLPPSNAALRGGHSVPESNGNNDGQTGHDQPPQQSRRAQQQQQQQQHQNQQLQAAPVAAPAPAPKPIPVAEPSLLDFMDDPVPAPAPVSAAAPVPSGFGFVDAGSGDGFTEFTSASVPVPAAQQQQQQQQDGFGAFSDFTGAFSGAPASSASSAFGNFDLTQPMNAAAAPEKPKASADAILSLYGGGGASMGGGMSGMLQPQQQQHPHQQHMQQGGHMMMGGPSVGGGMGMGMGMGPQMGMYGQQQQQRNMMVGGQMHHHPHYQQQQGMGAAGAPQQQQGYPMHIMGAAPGGMHQHHQHQQPYGAMGMGMPGAGYGMPSHQPQQFQQQQQQQPGFGGGYPQQLPPPIPTYGPPPVPHSQAQGQLPAQQKNAFSDLGGW